MSPHHKMILSRMLFILSLTLMLPAFAPHALSRAQSATAEPAALIKYIVINDKKQTDANLNQAKVTRGSNGETVAASAGLLLYRGDLIETFQNTQLTVLFLDEPVAERANEVIIDANARIGISSTDSWWGKILVKVKRSFTSRSRNVRLGARGTEYEFNVLKDREDATVIVLEGSVDAQEGNFDLVGAKQTPDIVPEFKSLGATYATSLFKSFAHAAGAQEQYGRTIDIEQGHVSSFNFDFTITNSCGLAHRFEFRTSGAPWLQLSVDNRISISPRSSRAIRVIVTTDARYLPLGQHRGRIYAVCLDCAQESQCNKIQLEWPIILTVNAGDGPGPTPSPSPSPRPSPSPTSSPQTSVVNELERMDFTRAVDQPAKASESQVVSVLNWTNEVILAAQPTYVARNLIPHFTSRAYRGESFWKARQDSILLKNKPGSNKILGDVYNDWEEGARAVTAYEQELKNDRSQNSSAQFVADVSEAYRLTGQLSEAQRRLERVSGANRQSAAIQNALGNLNLDFAEVALDKKDSNRARDSLKKAEEAYQTASQSQQLTGRQVNVSAEVIQSNLGEVYLANGDIAQQEKNTTEARKQYEEAAQLFSSLQQPTSQYPYPVTDLGRVYHGLGNVAMIEGKRGEATVAYERAKAQHNEALKEHKDFAEAYLNLGDLAVDLGDEEAAKKYYRQAIKARPEQPAPYYPLAVLLQREDRQMAEALASVYLKLQPEEKKGERARNAEQIKQGKSVPLPQPVRPGSGGGGNGNGGGTQDGEVFVPNLVNMNSKDAVRAIRAEGLTLGNVNKRSDPQAAETVLEQSPPAGTKVKKDSFVSLIVSSGGGRTNGDGGGERTIKVPNVHNDKRETAIRKIQEKGLRVGQVTEQSANCKSIGKVLQQNPAKDTKLARNDVVDLVIGAVGDDGVTVPEYRGRNQDDVKRDVKANGLKLDRVKGQLTEGIPAGTVVEQQPAAGTRMARDCEIEITVAIESVVVGNYIGMPEQEARSSLSRTGLRADSISQKSRTNVGRVLDQSPRPGERIAKGETVRLVVAVEITEVLVPDVRQMQMQDAINKLRQSGLAVGNIQYQEHSDYTPGTVLQQSPSADQRVEAGTRVNLVVAKAYVIRE